MTIKFLNQPYYIKEFSVSESRLTASFSPTWRTSRLIFYAVPPRPKSPVFLAYREFMNFIDETHLMAKSANYLSTEIASEMQLQANSTRTSK